MHCAGEQGTSVRLSWGRLLGRAGNVVLKWIHSSTSGLKQKRVVHLCLSIDYRAPGNEALKSS